MAKHDDRILEDRKTKEIEHSRVRRRILAGFERHSDTNKSEEVDGLDNLIRDKDAFKHHFSNVKFYSITQESETYEHEWLRERCGPGVKVLDFACGSGENGIFAAQCGADVIGIDISPEGVENANFNARQLHVADHCRFEVMDGESMAFPNNSFDVCVEYGALHHVDLEKAMSELNRVIKPNGEMICIEALRHNQFIHWYRKRTPHLRTQWEVEHILGTDDLSYARKFFGDVKVKFFHLAILFAVPFRKTKIFGPLCKGLGAVDRLILRNPSIGKFGWIMIFTMSNPRKLT
jgi:ubiquinone/menaquinone biosynthesis C-methylase UbiE